MGKIEKYIKYKNKYLNLKNTLNFYPIDLVLNNLGSYYKIIKKQYELHSGGGHNETTSDDTRPKTRKEKKYYQKYKNLIKSSALSINYYKNMVQIQISNQARLNNYFQNMIRILKFQRDKLVSGYNLRGNDIKKEEGKIGEFRNDIKNEEEKIGVVKKVSMLGNDYQNEKQKIDNIHPEKHWYRSECSY